MDRTFAAERRGAEQPLRWLSLEPLTQVHREWREAIKNSARCQAPRFFHGARQRQEKYEAATKRGWHATGELHSAALLPALAFAAFLAHEESPHFRLRVNRSLRAAVNSGIGSAFSGSLSAPPPPPSVRTASLSGFWSVAAAAAAAIPLVAGCAFGA